MRLLWQQKKVYLSSFGFKTSPIYFRKSHKVSRKKSLSSWSYAPKASRGGGGGGHLLSPMIGLKDKYNLQCV